MVSRADISISASAPCLAAKDNAIRCVVMRGGTSRGLFFHEKDLSSDPAHKDRILMGAVGGADPRHLDGLGGGDMLLSKVAIVARSKRGDADVECEFANIPPGSSRPSYGTNCGNLVGAVALFSVEEGLVAANSEKSSVRVLNRNSGGIIEVRLGEVDDTCRELSQLAGMPDTGTRVDLDFVEPVGAYGEQLLPTGNERDTIQLDGGRSVDISVVDAGALYVFVKGHQLGLTATETARVLSDSQEVFGDLEHIRAEVAMRLGIVGSTANAALLSPDVPKLAIVGSPMTYRCDGSSKEIVSNSIDLVSRIISSQQYHKAYAVTGAIAAAVAATIEGSTVHEVVGGQVSGGLQQTRIGHPSGVMACEVEVRKAQGANDIAFARIRRTARRVSQGTVFVPG